jgi:pimeloyl-ACP methyl ester carboxylesterase
MDTAQYGSVEVGDSVIDYEIIGEGMPILMLHGWSVDRELMKGCMEPVFETVSEKFRRVYLDLPGMGKSKAGDSIRNADQMLDVILAFVDRILPGARILLAGESFGCFLARGFLHARPDVVDGLLLICPCVIPGAVPQNVPPLRVLRSDDAFFEGIPEEDKQGFQSFHSVQTMEVYARYKAEIEPAFARFDRDFLEKRLDGAFSFPLQDIPVPFDKPALILAGRQDHVVGYKNPFRLTEDYTRATFAALDMAGHNLQIEQKALFEALVGDWLKRVCEEAE